MSQELIDSVTALTEETTQLLEVYTQESLTLNTKVANAADSAAAAKASEDAAASSEANSANSEALALQYKNEAEILTQLTTWQQYKADAELAAINAASSEANALTYSNAAGQHKDNAALSASNAASSESNANDSEEAASLSESKALASELAAKASETNAAQSETAASTSESNALASEQSANTHKNSAASSATAAANSESSAANSESNAAQSETNSANSAASALASANSAQLSATSASADAASAAASEASANTYKNDAQSSASTATTKASEASASAANALSSANDSAQSASESSSSALAASNSETASATSAINAASSEANALASEQAAESHKDASALSAASASSDADRAASAVGDVTWKQYARKDAEMEQMRRQNLDARAASGFDHMGKHRTDSGKVPINEGMWSSTTGANQLYIGNESAGTSSTPFAVTCIAGFVSKLCYINNAYKSQTKIKFAPSERGTKVFDSTGDVRGSGKAQLDLSVEVDPKYGDVAADDNEAVARAFEGEIPYGDFRDNFSGDGWLNRANGTGTTTIVGSVAQFYRVDATNRGAIEVIFDLVQGEEYTLSFDVGGDGSNASVQVSFTDDYGNVGRSTSFNGEDWNVVTAGSHETTTFTATSSQANMYILAITSGTSSVSNIVCKRSTEEVVINPVDMFGCESWLEIVSEAKPYVYPGGDVQTQAAEMNGIATERSNRPDTYYAAYRGDTTSAGLGVDFWSATTEQKIAMLNDVDNNLFLVKDEYGVDTLVQWRDRLYTERSLGNGKWKNIDSNLDTATVSGLLTSSSILDGRLLMQGSADARSYGGIEAVVNTYHNYGSNDVDEKLKTRGVFTGATTAAKSFGMFGHCHFHVWGAVSRLNQGAYHPSFNPMGTKLFAVDTVGDGVINTYANWYAGVVPSKVNSILDCFIAYVSGESGSIGADGRTSAGVIGGNSGHPDGLFYDAIYASGQGGVIDYRMPSWCMGSKEAASLVFQKVVNGIYRGEECLVTSKPYLTNARTGNFANKLIYIDGILDFVANELGIVAGGGVGADAGTAYPEDAPHTYGSFVANDGVTTFPILGIRRASDGSPYIVTTTLGYDEYRNDFVTNIPFVLTAPTTIPVSGNFTMQDVIGDPVNTLATPQLANGWLGRWIGFNAGVLSLSRKVIAGISLIGSADNGDSWTVLSPTLVADKNELNSGFAATIGNVAIYTYTTFAKQTKQSIVKGILGAEGGLGSVFATNNYRTPNGSLLGESLLGKVLTDNPSLPRDKHYMLTGAVIKDGGRLDTTAGLEPTHSPIDLAAGTEGSPAVKMLWHQTSDNQVANLSLLWNEMKWTTPVVSSTPLTPNSGQNVTAGVIYPIEGFNKFPDGTAFIKFETSRYVNWAASQMDTWVFDPIDGTVHSLTDITGVAAYQLYILPHQMWGDNSAIRLVSGLGTFINRNGETCMYGSSELAIPYGFIKNQAKAGAQVTGVDL